MSVVQVIGTTGVGKSQLGIDLAKRFNGEIINSDSMQVYKGFDIITNKHKNLEVPHHLLSFVEGEYRIDEYERDASSIIEQLHHQGKLPIVVGGTAYYATCLLFKDMLVTGGVDVEEDRTTEDLYAELQKVDPVMAERWHPNDRRKIIRSLGLYHGGLKQSDLYASQRGQRLQEARYPTLIFWLWSEQSILDEKLDRRVDEMIEEGLFDEIRSMQKEESKGVYQAIGYKEFIPYLEGGKVEPCIEQMKAATRRYARKQVKWIRNKLLQQVNRANIPIVLLDVNAGNATERAIKYMSDFLAGNLIVPDHPLLVPNKTVEQSSDPSQWQAWTCEICAVHTTTQAERDIHLTSRAHRRKVNRTFPPRTASRVVAPSS